MFDANTRVLEFSTARTEFDAGRAVHAERRDGEANGWLTELIAELAAGLPWPPLVMVCGSCKDGWIADDDGRMECPDCEGTGETGADQNMEVS